jgi:hypothetical protein
MLLAWERDFFEGLKEQGPPEMVAACRHPIKKAIRSTLDWCLAHGEGMWATKEKLSDTAYLVRDLYEAVTAPLNASPKLKNPSTLWDHLGHARLTYFLRTATPDELARAIGTDAVKEVANTYIARPWMQNPHLDWVFLETLLLGENLAFRDHVMKQRYGLSYALYGTGWKAQAFRLVTKPLSFALNWLLPGALLLWLGEQHPLTAFCCAVAYYGLNLFLLASFVVARIRYRLREGAFPARKPGELLGMMHAAYEQMAEEVIHVASLQAAIATAREKGAVWPAQVYVILDAVAARSPSGWNRSVGWDAR